MAFARPAAGQRDSSGKRSRGASDEIAPLSAISARPWSPPLLRPLSRQHHLINLAMGAAGITACGRGPGRNGNGDHAGRSIVFESMITM